MRKLILIITFVFFYLQAHTQTYPFQNPILTEDERIRNLISLMTLDEKIICLSSGIAVPRLGIKGTHPVEGLHGLVNRLAHGLWKYMSIYVSVACVACPDIVI